MTVPRDVYDDGRPSRSVDAGRLWTGGVATALVAALVALVRAADRDRPWHAGGRRHRRPTRRGL